jgi:1-phosphatidylinositol-3-phosphate 5-kinase
MVKRKKSVAVICPFATMESPLLRSPVQSTLSVGPGRSRSSTRVGDDVPSLTSFNPFSEEDESDQSSYALVTSLFSRMKSSFATPLAAASAAPPAAGPQSVPNIDQRRPSAAILHNNHASFTSRSSSERPVSLKLVSAVPAPPLVSLTPVVFEAPSFGHDPDRSPSRGAHAFPFYEVPDGGAIGTSIPGFPIQDDARSIRTTASFNRSASVSKVIRRIRGEGMSKINNSP